MKTVYADMVGDLFHGGHVSFFKKARELGDQLVVGVHSSEVCESYKRRPVLSLAERIAVIEACRFVDRVIPNAPMPVSEKFIEKYKLDIVVHGDDISPLESSQWYQGAIKMGIFQTVQYTSGISTTEIIERIKSHF